MLAKAQCGCCVISKGPGGFFSLNFPSGFFQLDFFPLFDSGAHILVMPISLGTLNMVICCTTVIQI